MPPVARILAMQAEREGIGCGLILLLGGLAMPLVSFLVWGIMFIFNVVFDVPISLDWAFGIIILSGLSAGPAVAWLVRLRGTRANLGKGST
jgi:hypothetical protein